MVEPTRTDRNVDLTRNVGGCAHLTGIENASDLVDDRLQLDRSVMRLADVSALVAAPAQIDVPCRAHRTENSRLGLIFSYDRLPQIPIVYGVAATRTVPPDLVYLSVARQYLGELICKIIVVIILAPMRRVSVPGRDIQTYLKSVFVAGVDELAHDVSLAVLIGAVLDRMLGVCRGPKAKSVVVLDGEYRKLKSRLLCHFQPLIRVERGRVENILYLRAASPLRACKGIDSEMEKYLFAYFIMCHLTLVGCRAEGLNSVFFNVYHNVTSVKSIVAPLTLLVNIKILFFKKLLTFYTDVL